MTESEWLNWRCDQALDQSVTEQLKKIKSTELLHDFKLDGSDWITDRRQRPHRFHHV